MPYRIPVVTQEPVNIRPPYSVMRTVAWRPVLTAVVTDYTWRAVEVPSTSRRRVLGVVWRLIPNADTDQYLEFTIVTDTPSDNIAWKTRCAPYQAGYLFGSLGIGMSEGDSTVPDGATTIYEHRGSLPDIIMQGNWYFEVKGNNLDNQTAVTVYVTYEEVI